MLVLPFWLPWKINQKMILPIFLPIGNPNIYPNVPNAILCGRPFGGKLEFEIKLVGFSSFFKKYIHFSRYVCPNCWSTKNLTCPCSLEERLQGPIGCSSAAFNSGAISPHYNSPTVSLDPNIFQANPMSLLLNWVILITTHNFFSALSMTFIIAKKP